VSALAEKVARRHTAFPVQKIGTTLVVALASPKDLNALDDIRFASGCDVQTVLALEDEILSAINRYYRDEWLLPDTPAPAADAVVIDSPMVHPPVRDQAAERSAVAVLERIIARATADGASDIHLEPRQDDLRIRCRVDGTFRDLAIFDLALAPALVARLKVLSNMDLAEHRLPQDGRFSVTVGDQHLDVRTSTYPTVHGEKAVMRLLDSSGLRLHLDRIGLSGATLVNLRELIHRPEGIVLITGPTGSGKTSTLYAALAELVSTGKNIVTIEDPVEYALPGVNQGQTNNKAGFTFAAGMRAVLRQDPDVIMVGEIRDRETLETAIEASLTGHLVLSTLHTNSAVASVARLHGDGSRAVPARIERARHHGAAPCPADLPHVPGASDHAHRAPQHVSGRRAAGVLPGCRVPRLPRHRVPRAAGDLRAAADHRRNPGARTRARVGRAGPRCRTARRDDYVARRVPGGRAGGRHYPRRSAASHAVGQGLRAAAPTTTGRLVRLTNRLACYLPG